MPKVQPIYDTRERARAPRESTPIQNERPRGAAGILRRGRAAHATQTGKKPPTPYYLPCRRICQAQSGANEPPHHKRVLTGSAKVLLDLRESARGLAQTGGDALRVRTPAAARDLRKNHEKAAERKERQHPHERQLEAGFFSIQETTWPQGFPPWGQEGAPQQKEAQLCRESRVTRASRRRWDQASR